MRSSPATFALGALLVHDGGTRRERPGLFPFAAAALALALSCGEDAVATIAYVSRSTFAFRS